jgi:4-diphosphocytidyl-2-C-methyl-D-erythritol kinase
MLDIRESAFAKLNLSLDVVGKRGDGYHDMRMVMQTVSLCDEIHILLREDGKTSVSTNLHFLPCDERNIAFKAVRLFFSAIGRPELGAEISITKHVPVCAGMGGGSSDGAAVLRGLNTALGSPLSVKELESLAAVLGSDVPFCIRGGTVLAEGRGEILTPLSPLPDCHIVICKPKFSVSTPTLFGLLDGCEMRLHPDTAGMLLALENHDLCGVARRMFNVFEDVLPRYRSEVSEIKKTLSDHGALGCCMTGTGSAVFGVFDSAAKAFEAKSQLRRRYREVFMAIPQPCITV